MKIIVKILKAVIMISIFMTTAACSISENPTKNLKSTSDHRQSSAGIKMAENLDPMVDNDEPITFKVFIRDPGTVPSKNNLVLNRITELTGVTMEYEYLFGDLAQKQGVMIASQDYPDAIFAEATKFIDAGAFIPLEDKLENYPNLYAHYAPHARKMTAVDGHQYVLEIYDVVKNPAPVFTNTGAGFFIQKAVLEEAGFVIPRTVDEYFSLIEAYKLKYPTIEGFKTTGFEILSDGWRDFCLRNPAQHLMGAGNDGDVFVDQNTYTASLYQITNTAREYYRKLNDAYHKGIIEAETFTQSYDQYIAKISHGTVLGFFDQGWNFMNAENVLKVNNKFNRTYISVPITNSGVTDNYLDAPSATITGVNGLGISKKCKNPDRLLAFFDWLLKEDVQNFLQWGEEGKDYVVLDNGGKMLTAARRAINNDDVRKRDLTGVTLWSYTPKRQGLYDDGSPCGPLDSEDEYMAALSEYDKKFLDHYGFKYPSQFLSEPIVRPAYYPVWAMAIEDGSTAKVAWNKVVDTCRKYYPRLVLSSPGDFDPLWDAFVDEIKKGNPQIYLDEVNHKITEAMR